MKLLSTFLEEHNDIENKYEKMKNIDSPRVSYDKLSHKSLMDMVKESICSNNLPDGAYKISDNIYTLYYTDEDYPELFFKWIKYINSQEDDTEEPDNENKEELIQFSITVGEETKLISQSYINCSEIEGVQYCNPSEKQFFKLQYSYSSFEKAMDFVLENRYDSK